MEPDTSTPTETKTATKPKYVSKLHLSLEIVTSEREVFGNIVLCIGAT